MDQGEIKNNYEWIKGDCTSYLISVDTGEMDLFAYID